MRLKALAPWTVAALTAAVFWPCLDNGFIFNWDDSVLVIHNRHIRGFTLENLEWMFAKTGITTYQPLTWIVYALIYKLQGAEPLGFHLLSLSLHTANAVLVYAVARQLLAPADRNAAAAMGAALLFALHPIQAEVVAWSTGIADLLALSFFLLSIHFYLKRNLALTFVFFVFAGLSRWRALVLPAALLLLDYYPLRRRGALLEKLPFAALAGLLFWVDARAKQVPEIFDPGAMRPMTSAWAALVLPSKLLWPADLLPFYAVHEAFEPAGPAVLAAAGALGAGLFWKNRAARGAVLFYLAALSPVLLFPRHPPILLHGHYAYISCLGFFLLAGGALSAFRRLGWTLAAVLLLMFGWQSRQEVRAWSNAETFWRTGLARKPGDPQIRSRLAAAIDHERPERR